MDFEVCPIGTERLLRSLGYALSPGGGAWLPIASDSDLPASPPDRLGRVAAARMSEISPEAVVMTVVEKRYRRREAIDIRRNWMWRIGLACHNRRVLKLGV